METKMLIDNLFHEAEDPWIVVCGDFNADLDDVPVEAVRGRVENTSNGELPKRVTQPCEMSISESARFSLYNQGKQREYAGPSAGVHEYAGYYKGSEVHNELFTMNQLDLQQTSSFRNRTMRR